MPVRRSAVDSRTHLWWRPRARVNGEGPRTDTSMCSWPRCLWGERWPWTVTTALVSRLRCRRKDRSAALQAPARGIAWTRKTRRSGDPDSARDHGEGLAVCEPYPADPGRLADGRERGDRSNLRRPSAVSNPGGRYRWPRQRPWAWAAMRRGDQKVLTGDHLQLRYLSADQGTHGRRHQRAQSAWRLRVLPGCRAGSDHLLRGLLRRTTQTLRARRLNGRATAVAPGRGLAPSGSDARRPINLEASLTLAALLRFMSGFWAASHVPRGLVVTAASARAWG